MKEKGNWDIIPEIQALLDFKERFKEYEKSLNSTWVEGLDLPSKTAKLS